MCGECFEDLTPRIDYWFLPFLVEVSTNRTYLDYDPQASGASFDLLPFMCGVAYPRKVTPVGNCDQRNIDLKLEINMLGVQVVFTADTSWSVFEGIKEEELQKIGTELCKLVQPSGKK